MGVADTPPSAMGVADLAEMQLPVALTTRLLQFT